MDRPRSTPVRFNVRRPYMVANRRNRRTSETGMTKPRRRRRQHAQSGKECLWSETKRVKDVARIVLFCFIIFVWGRRLNAENNTIPGDYRFECVFDRFAKGSDTQWTKKLSRSGLSFYQISEMVSERFCEPKLPICVFLYTKYN